MNAAIYSLFVSLALRMTVITAFVMLIKLIFRERLSAAAHCAVWVMLLAQTLLCIGNISIPARTSIYNVVDMAAAEDMVLQTAPTAHFSAKNIIALVYASGVTAAVLWYLSIFVIHRFRVYKSVTITEPLTCGILKDIRAELKIADDIVLKRGSYAHTIGNTVVLPCGYSEFEERQVILHELCHYKHRDNLKLWAAVFVICLNWFNPLIWLAFGRFRRDIEMYCDDSVLKITDSRKAYAMTLVKTASDHIRFVPGASSAANGTHEVAKRVKRIAAWKKKKPVWLVAAIMSSVCVSCLCLTDSVSRAVGETVSEVTATPEPVSVAKELEAIIETPKPTQESTAAPQKEKPVARQAAPSRTPEPTRAVTAPTPRPAAQSAPTAQPAAQSVEPSAGAVTQTEGTAEAAPKVSVSANGNKETYNTDDGKTVVLQYDNGNLQTGYIIDGG